MRTTNFATKPAYYHQLKIKAKYFKYDGLNLYFFTGSRATKTENGLGIELTNVCQRFVLFAFCFLLTLTRVTVPSETKKKCMNSVDAYIFVPILCNQNNLLDQGRKILLKTTSSVRAKRATLHHFSLLYRAL